MSTIINDNNSKCKILLVGSIGPNVQDFVSKLCTLQKSKAGPFDVCFCVGPVVVDRNDKSSLLDRSDEIPLPVYLQNGTSLLPRSKEEEQETIDDDGNDGVTQVAPNLYVFTRPTIASIDVGKHHDKSKTKTLVVVSCPPRVQWDNSNNDSQKLRDTLTHVSYVGCDVLLSEEWPQGIGATIQQQQQQQAATAAGTSRRHDYEMYESYDVAQVALYARPRYHVAPAAGGGNSGDGGGSSCTAGTFVQSPPFRHLASSSSTFTPQHNGRFLALCDVVSPRRLKEIGGPKKGYKFVHALGIVPLRGMSDATNANDDGGGTTTGILVNPYTDASYATTTTTPGGHNEDGGNAVGTTLFATTNVGLSEAQARRLLSEQQHAVGDVRWTINNKKRSRRHDNDNSNDDDDDNDENDNSNNTTLFVHGLDKDVRGMLQTSSAALLQHFAKFGVLKVRRPPGGSSSFCFLEFPSHDLAKQCLEEECGGQQTTTVEGIPLTIKWATMNKRSRTTTTRGSGSSGAPPKRQRRLVEVDAMDSSTIYYRLPSKILTTEYASTSEELRILMETSLEHALADPTVTAKNEPALQVKIRRPTKMEDINYGFLEFASHAAASMALAQLTGSTDGGLIVEQQQLEQNQEQSTTTIPPPLLLGVALHWAHDAKAPSSTDDDGGLKFQRKHFPPDARTDCWFCLASPTCEKHLIVSVHEECYIAMPKGPIHPRGHALIVPVTHSSKGALVDRSVAAEMEDLKKRLQQHASHVYDMDLFVFERAIQTKGGYHTHVQCIPLERGLGFKLQATMMAMAGSIPGFELKELNSDLALSAVMASGGDVDDEEDGGYFYAEILMAASKDIKRFLFNARSPNAGHVVPLQFGREVVASVMENPDLAHWKACVQSEEKETELTKSFRESFAPFAAMEQD